ncbi:MULTISPECIES: efflux RND transporter permease subunit [Proteiniphilum]|jgi:multidrug efflux pump subunit AcrB|uniref:efflux RND transporter permease subunit n=1 Tax=Proteiniphilum TaxID=294702 RepID=UPI001EEBBF4B|nr:MULTISPECIES: efflux RND transporter permease subunit [Proteiniphilum]ULB34915.1 efflux RND transporter permease subunit [Proteiniphilum propionicum]
MALNTAMIGMQVRQNLYGAESGDFSEDGNDYGIVVQYAPEHQNEVNKLKEMQVSNLLGQQIPLSAIADIVESLGPLEIQRQSQQRYVKTTADLNGVSLGEATNPFTLVGVILASFVTGITLSVTTFIGLIMLVGIVVNNGIVLVDYINMLRKRNYPLRDAVMEAGRSRLRPI